MQDVTPSSFAISSPPCPPRLIWGHAETTQSSGLLQTAETWTLPWALSTGGLRPPDVRTSIYLYLDISRILLVFPSATFIPLAILLSYHLYGRPALLKSRIDHLSVAKNVSYAVSLVSIASVLGLIDHDDSWRKWGLTAYAVELVVCV